MADAQPPAKRAACDRCRTQKLRCLRVPGHPQDACIRCVRSQMECISSSSKRPGRPRNSTNANRQVPVQPPKTSKAPEASIPPPPPPVEIQPIPNVDDWFGLGILDTDFDMCTPPWATIDSGFGSLDSGSTAHTLSSLSTPAEGPSNCMALPGLMNDFSLTEHFPNLPSERDETILPYFGQPPPPQDFDHGFELSLLQRELSKQLFTIKSAPWDMATVMRLSYQADNIAHSPMSNTSDVEYNPLGNVVRASTGFSKLLRSVQSQIVGEQTIDMKNGTPHSMVQSRLSITDLLTILSCHMLTISIYDIIFSRLADQMTRNPGAFNSILQAAPSVLFGGIEIAPRLDTLTYFLYSLTESHLRPIEILLGLPDEYCVSAKRNYDGSTKQLGLFSGQSGQLLFSTLMRVEEERASEDRGGLGVIASLKKNIRWAHGLQ